MLAKLATLTLTPLLLAQALYVRATTERLPEPAGPRAGRNGRGPALKLLVCGDSAAAGVGVTTQQQALCGQLVAQLRTTFRVHWCVAATTGHTTADTIARLQASRGRRFDVAVVSQGVNDATTGTSPQRWREQLDELHAVLRQRYGVRQLLFAAVPPMHQFPALPRPLRQFMGRVSNRLDAELADWCTASTDRLRLPFAGGLDPAGMARDGFHPGAAIYAQVAEAAAAAIRRHWLAIEPGSPRLDATRAMLSAAPEVLPA
jgi:lysophospholipase L1-like esterase